MKNVLRIFAVLIVTAIMLSACSIKKSSDFVTPKNEKEQEQIEQTHPTEAEKFDQTSAEETLRAYLYAILDGDIDTLNDCLLVKIDPDFGNFIVKSHRMTWFLDMTKDMIKPQEFEFFPQNMLEQGKAYVQADEFEFWQSFQNTVRLNFDENAFVEMIEGYKSENPDWKQAMRAEIEELSDEALMVVSCGLTADELYQHMIWLEKNWDEIDSMSNLSKLDVNKITAFCKVAYNSEGYYYTLAQVNGEWYVTHSSLGGYFGS